MIETNNLFEVTMGKVTDEYGNLNEESSKYYTQALNFQNQMNEKLATNKSELKKFQSMYYNMFKSQGINKDKAYFMSENLTKAGYDIASLYNLNTEDAMNKIKSGIAGQVESLRTIGIDVSESSLTKVLNEVGIDRSVQKLSYAEKEVARYIAIIEQAGVAQGDFAKTFESPANQLRVFTNQLTELKQVAGSFIMNAFGGIIVWANAIIMAIKEILKSIASVFGWDLDTGGANLSETTGVSGLNDGLGSASKKAKELKKQLMGFDEINNIDPASQTSGSGSSGGTATGIDNKLLDALKEWDDKMSSISGKAQELRDKILDFLGFTRDINGNLTWSWDKMNNIAKVIVVIAGIIGGIYLIGKISKLIKWLGSLWNILKTGTGATTTFGEGLSIIGKVINGLKSGFTNFGSWISMVVEQYKIFRNQGNGVISSLKLTASSLNETGQGIKGFATKAVTLVGGLAGIAGGSVLTFKSMNDLTTGTIGTTEAMAKLAGGLGIATASGIIAGSQFGTVGMIIGAVAGFTTSAISAFMGYKDGIESLNIPTSSLTEEIKNLTEEIDNNRNAYQQSIKSIKDNYESKLIDAEYSEKLTKQLSLLVDENGKVKQGNESRVDFILNELNNALGIELSRNGELITKNGEVVKSYRNLQLSINETIKKKKEEAKQEVNIELYKEAIKEQIQLERDKQKSKEELAKAEKEYNDLMAKNLGDWTLTHDESCKQIIQNYIDIANKYTETVNDYGKCTEDVTYYSQQMTNDIIDSTGVMSKEMLQQGQVTSEKLQEMVTNNKETWETTYNNLNIAQQSAMLAQSTTLDKWSPAIEEKWRDMADNSAKEFLNGISQVDNKTQEKILSTVTTTQNMTPDMATAWQNLANESFIDFSQALSQVTPETQDEILKAMASTQELTGITAQAWASLATTSKDRYNKALSSLDTDTRNKIQSAVDEINRKEWTAGQAGNNVGSTVKTKFDSGLGDTSNSATNFLQGFVNILRQSNPLGIFGTIGQLTTNIINKWNKGLGNASPSKKTRKSAIFFTQGFAIQLEKEIPEVVKEVLDFANNISEKFDSNLKIGNTFKELNKGISVNTEDFAVDTNQYIDYGAVSGSIQSQNNIVVGQNIIQELATAVKEAMNKANINVNVEAKTEEGVIVKKATEGFKQYVTQTGELPFPVPV